MFHSPSVLPHLIAPSAYRDDAWADRERGGLLASAWHLVGTQSELKHPGDFLTTELLGVPLQIRKFEGQLIAISNVCAHRHCLISSLPRGNSASMRCQYHGWEYGADGYTRKIPCAKDFAPIDREQLRLPRYNVETCGDLIFVRLAESGIGLMDFLGPIVPKILAGFGQESRCFLRWQVCYDANWKVAIENSLEAYHVASVHPATFGSDPGEKRSEHILEDRHTAFGTDLPFAHSKLDLTFQRCEGWVMKRLGRIPTRRYWQHHVFPNLLCSFTDAISLVHCVVPTGTTRSISLVYQYGPCPMPVGAKRVLARIWGFLEAACTKRILQEDIEMYPKIQQGLNASQQRGTLARSEERIHRFQEFLSQQLQAGASKACDPIAS